MPHLNTPDIFNRLGKKIRIFLFVIRNIRKYVFEILEIKVVLIFFFDIYASSVRVLLGYTVLLDFENKKEILWRLIY